jgi:hypothetical protein
MTKLTSRSSRPIGNRTSQTLKCKYCEEPVSNVDINATAITCYKCVMKLCNGVQLKEKKETK